MKCFDKIVLLVTIFTISANTLVFAQDSFKLIHFDTEDGGKIEAAYFNAKKNSIVIFTHGAIFNKKSWYFLAQDFQEKGVSVLSIDFRGYGNSVAGTTNKKLYDILGAISYAKKQGFNNITIVGASMGGAAVLQALSFKQTTINKVILLAPAGGSPITSNEIDKLFVVSKEEGLYKRVHHIYTESESPKQLKEYSGKAHAQHLFKTGYANALIKQIIDFVVSPE